MTEKTQEQLNSEQQLEMLGDAPAVEVSELEPEKVEVISAENSLLGLLFVGHNALKLAGMQNTAKVWDEGACTAFSAAVVPVLRKYPWGGKVLAFLETGAGVEEMALFAVAMPLTMATVNAVRMDMKKPDQAPAKEPEPEKPAPQYEQAQQDTCAADVD